MNYHVQNVRTDSKVLFHVQLRIILLLRNYTHHCSIRYRLVCWRNKFSLMIPTKFISMNLYQRLNNSITTVLFYKKKRWGILYEPVNTNINLTCLLLQICAKRYSKLYLLDINLVCYKRKVYSRTSISNDNKNKLFSCIF